MPTKEKRHVCVCCGSKLIEPLMVTVENKKSGTGFSWVCDYYGHHCKEKYLSRSSMVGVQPYGVDTTRVVSNLK